MSGFQKQVNIIPAPGVPWDFCSTNPRFNVDAGEHALVAGSNCFLGFVWRDPYNQEVNSNGSGPVCGIVPRNWQGLITTYLAEETEQVLPGIQCFVINGGDVWAPNGGTTEAILGLKAYANFNDGSQVAFAPTGSAPSSFTSTSSTIAAETWSSAGSTIAPTYDAYGELTQGILTTGSSVTGTIVIGSILGGTGVVTDPPTVIVSQLSGTTGGAGTYLVSNPLAVASATITGAYGLLTLGGTITGTPVVGDVLSGSGITAGTQIVSANGSNWNVTPSQAIGTAQAIDGTQWVETPWYAQSNGAPGEIIKISDHSSALLY